MLRVFSFLAIILCVRVADSFLADDDANAVCSLFPGFDCWGGDIGNQPTPTPQSCCDLCATTPNCKAFSLCKYDASGAPNPTCYMKSSCDSKQPKGDTTAGVLSAAPTPAPPPTPPPTPAPPTPPTPSPNLKGVQSTSDLNNLLTEMKNLPDFVPGPPKDQNGNVLTIDGSKIYQSYLGFGGAFTEAAAINWQGLSADDKVKVIELYFSAPEDGGHGYSIGRVPMNSCDFSPASYCFDDVAGDTQLIHFDLNVSHDRKDMIPFILAAQEEAKKVDGLKIFASPWSPPAWMKTNGQMTGSGHPGLKGEDQAAWALYFSKFFTAYKAQGIDLWGLTIQNEPEYAANWEACCYTAEQERDFLKNHLGPVMRRDHPDVKIMVYDHNKDHLVQWANTIFGDAEANKYADGIALHWYVGGGPQDLINVHNSFPDKFILPSEACNCGGVKLRHWDRALDLAKDIMSDINAWAVGWTDWNLVLSPQGGPNHLNNFCDANIIADPQNTLGAGTVIQQVSYYLMGHFSRYIRPNAVRVAATHGSMNIQVTAAHDVAKKKTSIVLINTGGEVTFTIYDVGANAHAAGITIPANSMQSYQYDTATLQGL